MLFETFSFFFSLFFTRASSRGARAPKNDEYDRNNKNKKKSSKFHQTLSLPTLCNINPRSIYHKLSEFHDFIKEKSVDCIFLSESWEKTDLTLDKVIKLDEHKVISNV